MQPTLQLPIAQRTALVTVDTARAVRGVDAESIFAEIDDGRIPWVFDIAAPGAARRELRLWARSIIAPDARQPLGAVLAAIIGTNRAVLHGGEVERLFLCSAQLIKQLHEAGELRGALVGHTRHLQRDSLIAFLTRRRVS